MSETLETLKELRYKTGAGMTACIKAIKDSNGDLNKAMSLIKERGQDTARNYESRTTKSGVVGIYHHHDKQKAALVLLACETDFVARVPNYISLANAIAQHIVAMNPSTVEELLKQPFVLTPDESVEQILLNFSHLCKEKIIIKNFSKIEI